MSHEAVEHYLQDNHDRMMQELFDYLRIPSVSSQLEHQSDMIRAAHYLADQMRASGLEHVEVMETGGHPVVYGDWLHAIGKPTAIVYGHYDVQPAEPHELWTTPAFEPTIRDNKVYARGATDDKAQVYMHIKTVEAYLRTQGTLPVNLKFCIEGEEEISSIHLPDFLVNHHEKLKADLMVISDGPIHAADQPSICVGLRGLTCFEIEVFGAKTDLHSGVYGGGVANPLHALAEIVASFHDETGRVAVAGFYDGVHNMSESIRANNRVLNPDPVDLATQLQVDQLVGERGFNFYEQTTARPTIEINGFTGGYTGENIKSIVPNYAIAKVSCRLVDEQQPDDILAKIEGHVARLRLEGVKVVIKPLLGGKPFVISPEHPFIQLAAHAYEYGFGKYPVFTRSGGSIPIVQTFVDQFHVPVVMMDMGMPGENMHAPDEHFHLINWERGLKTLVHFWANMDNTPAID
jgi:acetylornithine deacetylase/succinyl-diaminopimelate desuccinylase-like protein